MQSDDDLQTTLSKWPFILGDGLLVATALAIAILGDWQLTNVQVAACVVSVALGAALFVLPYVVEFRVRVREEADDRSADLRILHRELVGTQEQLESIEKQLEPIRKTQAAQSMQLDPLVALAETVDRLAEQIEAHEVNLRSQSGTEAFDLIRTEQVALGARVAELSERMRLYSEEKSAPAEVASEAAPEVEVKQKPKKSREPRKRRRPDARLLQRAIDEKGDHTSAAVSRIIESKKKKSPETGEFPAVEVSPEASDTELQSESTEEKKEGPNFEPNDEVDASAETNASAVEESPAVTEAAEAAPGIEPAEDLFAKAVPSQSPKRTRTKKSDTAVIASVFIGIGNKPYLRGSGGGLSWESGIAMEFEEIGKWRWIAPPDLEAPVELQVFRNDEDPDSNGTHTLEPGEQLSVSPVF